MLMSVRDLISKIHIHPTLGFSVCVAILAGTFTEMCTIFFIISFHEFGHWSAASYYNWRIRKIVFWMFGGVMETDEHGSKPIGEEMIVTIAGPFQHLVIYLMLAIASYFQLLPSSVLALAFQFNTTILFFNLLPIWPLDGGKLACLVLAKYLPFKKAHTYTILTSIMFIMLLLAAMIGFRQFILNTGLLFAFLLWENRIEWKQRFYVFLRFLIKRAETPMSDQELLPLIVEQDIKLIDLFAHFHRNYQHLILIRNNQVIVDEIACFHVYFNLKKHGATVRDVSEQQ